MVKFAGKRLCKVDERIVCDGGVLSTSSVIRVIRVSETGGVSLFVTLHGNKSESGHK
jgi:hypothetical protein